MKRPHPLAILLFLALLLLVAWLLNLVTLTTTFVEKIPYHSYWTQTELNREIRYLPTLPSFFVGVVAALLPALVLHRLLRRSMQFHLLTAILLLLSAATLLALNFHPQKVPTQLLQMDVKYIALHYGWPACLYTDPSHLATWNYSLESTFWTPVWHISALLGNALVALAILSLIALLSEFLLRRREPAK